MLNTKKLLYILPDMAYLAEMLAGKKPHSYSIQNFKQFNGNLIDGNKLNQENIAKLLSRLEPDTYGVVLADKVFTNTIVNIEKKTEAQVKEYLEEELIPSLHINSESHQIATFILSEYKGSFKVQLSAVQRSLLVPLKEAAVGTEIKIEKIFPLSWTVKSIVSLEPSITLIQMGQNLFMAKHYIGVDQPMSDKIDNLDRFVEAAKTLKGSEPSIQTVYLISNELVEEELKEKLSETLPIQQLADKTDEDAKLPTYVEKAITSAMLTISIPDFEIPEFNLSKVAVEAGGKAVDAEVVKADTDETEVADAGEKVEPVELPKPGSGGDKQEDIEDTQVKTLETLETIDEETPETEVSEPDDIEEIGEPEDAVSQEVDEEKEPESSEETAPQIEVGAGSGPVIAAAQIASGQQKTNLSSAEPAEESTAAAVPDDLDDDEDQEDVLLKFTDQTAVKQAEPDTGDQQLSEQSITKKDMKRKKVLKNKDGIGNFVKVFLIGFASFAITVAIGAGIGFGILQLSQPQPLDLEDPGDETVIEEVVPTEEPTPTPEPEIEREELSIKVVNATTQAGYAGQVASQVEEAGYGEVSAQNAAGDYEEGFYVLMQEENQALVQLLAEDLDLELEFSEGAEVEDAAGDFDAVIVLAQ